VFGDDRTLRISPASPSIMQPTTLIDSEAGEIRTLYRDGEA
jgi:hypothetical protein